MFKEFRMKCKFSEKKLQYLKSNSHPLELFGLSFTFTFFFIFIKQTKKDLVLALRLMSGMVG